MALASAPALPRPRPPRRASSAPTAAGRPRRRCARASSGRQAAREFEQAFAMHDESAYGLAAAHALIKAGRADVAAQRAQTLRERRPTLTLAYTLESHALTRASAAPPRPSALPAGAAGRRAARPRLLGVARRRAAALPPPRRSDPRLHAGAGAEDGRADRALPPRHVVQGPRHEGRGRRMRAHRACCSGWTAASWRRARSSSSSSARPAAGPAAAAELAKLRHGGAGRAGRPPRSRPAPFPHAVLRRRPARAAQGRAPVRAARGRPRQPAAAARRGPTTGGCASATCRPTSTSTPPAS